MAKKAVLLIGVVVAIALNIDSVEITRSLWQDKAAAQAYAALATDALGNVAKYPEGFEIKNEDGKVMYSFKKEAGDNLSGVSQFVGALPLPIGWDCQVFAHDDFYDLLWVLLQKLAGWAITALAIFLGAPFWFDLLGKIVNLRGAGAKPQPKPA